MKKFLIISLAVNILLLIALFYLVAYVYNNYYVKDSVLPDSSASVYYVEPLSLENKVNDYRLSKELTPLEHDERLCLSATEKVNDMVALKYFEHDSPTGNRFSDIIVKYVGNRYIGENLALSNKGEESIINGWITSPGHERNMSDVEFTRTCITTKYQDSFTYHGTTYRNVTLVVQHFAD